MATFASADRLVAIFSKHFSWLLQCVSAKFAAQVIS
jgi:hypothetical protein